ncbi:hypothetical protein N7488_001191 [Penicillium malachiteum]|nr:hypothetical protein N7488_001191 [Penicillium malachiteum]
MKAGGGSSSQGSGSYPRGGSDVWNGGKPGGGSSSQGGGSFQGGGSEAWNGGSSSSGGTTGGYGNPDMWNYSKPGGGSGSGEGSHAWNGGKPGSGGGSTSPGGDSTWDGEKPGGGSSGGAQYAFGGDSMSTGGGKYCSCGAPIESSTIQSPCFPRSQVGVGRRLMETRTRIAVDLGRIPHCAGLGASAQKYSIEFQCNG